MDQTQPPPNFAICQAVVNTTYDKSEYFSFLWEIERYSEILEGDNPPDKLTSPMLHGGPTSQHSWTLVLYPAVLKDGTRYMSVYVHLVAFGHGDRTPGRTMKTYFQISLLDRNNHRLTWLNSCRTYREGTSWGFYQFVPSAIVTSPDNNYLTNDVLKVYVEFITHGDLIHRVVKENNIPVEEKLQQSNLQFGKMFTDSMFTDLTVKGPKKSIAAHKCVLAAASPVFAAMFRTEMVEKETGTVSIQDFDDEVIQKMLEYIYLGEVDPTTANEKLVTQLILAADKYDLRQLKSECERLLIKYFKLTPTKAPAALLIADSSNASELKKFVVSYIKRNFQMVKQTKEFKDLIKSSRSELIYDIL